MFNQKHRILSNFYTQLTGMISNSTQRIFRFYKFFVFVSILFLSALHVHSQSLTSDSVTVSIAPGYDSVHKMHRFLFGEGYRKLWAAPVKVKVFNLAKEKGGLKILQRGGGLQTQSLRLKDAAGREWVLRSIQKYPERGLPEKLRKTVAKDILQDQVITGHPYSALTVPPLAAALDIPHSNPQIVYVPDDPAFGEHRKDFANTVLLFEEREPVDTFRTDNTEKAQRKLEDDNDNTVDQRLVLRARLLDLFMGDWDRHEDQWRWEVVKTNNELVYVPIPRDRDKVFYNTSGLLPNLLSHQWLKANLQSFGNEIREVEQYNYNNRYFDRYFLNGLDEADWKEQIAYVKSKMTDDLIRSAISRLPDTIYKLTGEKIINTLIARRSILEKEAMKYYRFLSKFPDVPASDKNEVFEINYKPDGHVSVAITKIKKDHLRDKVIYQRDFDPAVTDEVRLYGLGGNDVFKVNGTGGSGIKVRMVGGSDTDSFYVDNALQNRRRLVVYDRSDEQNLLPSGSVVKLRTSTDSTVNSFDRKSFVHDQKRWIGSAFYNPDQGFLLRAGFMIEKQGFRRQPYASRHIFYVNYATTWKSFMFTYSGDFKKAIGKNDLSIDLISRGPGNIDNFFGVGNETMFDDYGDDAIKFYQNHFDDVNGDIRLRRRLSSTFKVNAGIAAEFYKSELENNRNKFLNSYDFSHRGEKVFSEQFFTGVVAGAELNSRNDALMPFKGVYWNTELRAMKQLNGLKNNYGKISSELSFYIPIKDSTIILANRVAAGTIVGDAAYYQQFRLGGPINLRGYNINRFTGKSMVYHNLELRLKLFDFTSYIIPGTIGLVGFNDVGRVWSPGEKSSKWHNGYGGGLYIIPADLIFIQALIGHSEEGTQPYFSIGVRF
jgi:hypothetical protein